MKSNRCVKNEQMKGFMAGRKNKKGDKYFAIAIISFWLSATVTAIAFFVRTLG